MFCANCGAELSEKAKFCRNCGTPQMPDEERYSPDAAPSPGRPVAAVSLEASGGRVGYSDRINDPAFGRYLKNSNRWAAIFAVGLAVIAVVGFFIAGEVGSELDNPQALYQGLAVGSMFLLIALFQIMGRKRSKTWDGVVEDKKVRKKTRNQKYSDGSVYVEEYLEYTVLIRQDGGKRTKITTLNNDTVYNYYAVGDRVRHHGGLNSYEKYDKSKDRIIFCAACATLNPITDDYCFRCKCPLLK